MKVLEVLSVLMESASKTETLKIFIIGSG